MGEPGTTGEAIQIVRRAIYGLARDPAYRGNGVTELEIVNYCIAHKWPTPIKSFDKAMARLIEAHAAEGTNRVLASWGGTSFIDSGDPRYWLTAKGDLEEEAARRPWIAQVWDEARRPATVVSFAIGLLSGLLLGLLRQ